jgi:hypothetical protein
MGQPAELVAIGETVAIDLRIQAANQEMVVVTLGVLPAGVDAAGVIDGVAQHGGALLVQQRTGNDLDAGWEVFELRAGFAHHPII